MRPLARAALLAAWVAWAGCAACAATSGLAEPLTLQDATTVAPLPPVSVIAPRSTALAVPHSATTVTAADIAAGGPAINLSEALARVPGAIVAHRGNYAQDLQISVRGFGARASFGVRGIRLYTDGIPATMPDGQGQVTHFNLASAARIDVLRGPFSALYGASSGGVIALTSREVRDEAAVNLDVGSFGLAHVAAGIGARHGILAAGLDVSHTRVDGWRPQAEATRKLAHARAVWRSDAWTIHANLNRIEQNANDPLGLTRAEWRQNPLQTTAAALDFNTRKNATQTQAGAAFTHTPQSDTLRELNLVVYAGERSVVQWQALAPNVQTPRAHPGGVIDLDRNYAGLDARATLLLLNARWTLGAQAQSQTDDRRGYENFIGTTLGVTGNLRRNERNRATSRDVYVQVESPIAGHLTANLGVRSGRLHVDSRDRFLSNGDDGGERSYRFTNPVVGILARPHSTSSVFANVGGSYETPTLNELAYRADGTAGLNTQLRPQKAKQWELGARHHAGSARIEMALFGATTQSEIVSAANLGGRASFQNAAKTTRTGAELATNIESRGPFSAHLAITWLQAVYAQDWLTCGASPCTQANLVVARGNRLAALPRTTLFSEWVWTPSSRWRMAAEMRAQSRMAVNDRNSDFASGFATLGVAARYRWQASSPWQAEVTLRAANLADKRYAGTVIVNEANGRFFEPGEPRSISLQLAIRVK